MTDVRLSATWRALAREAGLAAEHMGFGATVLGRANYAQTAYYAQAFFSLSIGFERGCKLALLLDYSIDHKGTFPSSSTVRNYGHNLRRLLESANAIARKRGFATELPHSATHHAIINVLTEFSTNVTRYYNIESVTGEAAARDDPIASWHTLVTMPILQDHYIDRLKRKDEADAQIIRSLTQDAATVKHMSELGTDIDSMYEGAQRTSMANLARRWERRYVLQIARFIGGIISSLGELAQSKGISVPYLFEFFVIFDTSDSDFLSRKTWSIYPT
jgi:hypothetical protein